MLSFLLGNLEWIAGGIATLVGALFIRKSGRDAERLKNQKAKDKREEKIEDAIDDNGSAHWRERLQRRDK